MKIPALKIQQDGVDLYLAGVPARDLVNETHFKVDYWDPEKNSSDPNQGYQRMPEPSHVKKISDYINRTTGLLFPNAILVNSRSKIKFTPGDTPNMGTIESSVAMFITDGQHRMEGLKRALEEGRDIGDIVMPTVVVQVDSLPEVKQFYNLNFFQKKITTDLAQQLLRSQARGDTSLLDGLKSAGKNWELISLTLTESIAKADSVWQGRIKFANQKASAGTIINQNSFVKSLKPLLSNGIFELDIMDMDDDDEGLHKITKHICDFWEVIKETVPNVFADPKHHVMHKTTGVFPLHDFANALFSVIGKNNLTKTAMVQPIRRVFSALGMDSSDYWRRGNGEGAARFGSMGGFKIHSNQMKRALAALDVKKTKTLTTA